MIFENVYYFLVLLTVSVTKASVQGSPLAHLTSEQFSIDYHDNDGLDRTSKILNQEHRIADVNPESHVRQPIVSGRKFRTNEDRRDEDSRIDKGHNKSKQKTVFYNSYRRDESGTNSSFYEHTVDDGAEKHHHNGIARFGESSNNEFRDGNTNTNRRRFPNRKDVYYYNQRIINHRPVNGNSNNQEEAFAEQTPPPFRRQSGHGFRPGYHHGRQPYNNIPHQPQFDHEVADRYRQHFRVPKITVFDDPRPARFGNSHDRGYYPGPVPNGPYSGFNEHSQKPQLHILNPLKRYNDYEDDYPHHLESEPGRYRY